MSLCQPSGLCAHPCGGLSFAMDSPHHGSGFWAQVGLRAYPVPPVTRGPPACEHLSCCGHRKGLDVPPGREVPNSRNRSVTLCPQSLVKQLGPRSCTQLPLRGGGTAERPASPALGARRSSRSHCTSPGGFPSEPASCWATVWRWEQGP